MSELLAHLDETLDRTGCLWELHFWIVMLVYTAMIQFDDLYRDLFEEEGAFDSYRLFQRFDNKSLETGRALWDLSRQVLALPEVEEVFETPAGSEVLTALEGSSAGQRFLTELRAFLERYGQRGPTWSFSLLSWIEDPAPVIKNLKDYAARPDHDSAADLKTLAAEREQAVAGARERLKGYPQQVAGEFESLLKVAQMGSQAPGRWEAGRGKRKSERCNQHRTGQSEPHAGGNQREVSTLDVVNNGSTVKAIRYPFRVRPNDRLSLSHARADGYQGGCGR